MAEHGVDLRRIRRRAVHRQMQHDLAEFGRIFHPHAAVAERALVGGEQPLLRRVVQIDLELVREVELDAAERIGGARRLHHVDIAVGPTLHFEPHAIENIRVARIERQQFILNDRLRHVPGRIDKDGIHRCAEKRRRRLRFAGDNLGAPDQTVVAHHPEGVVRNIDHHIGLAEIARQPAPTFHIGDHAVDLLSRLDQLRAVDGGERLAIDDAGRLDVGAGLHVLDRVEQRLVIDEVVSVAFNAETLAQCRHTRILVARIDAMAVGNAIVGLGARLIVAQFGELALQGPEAVMRRIEAVEASVDIAGVGDLLEKFGRLRRVVAVIDFRRNARRRNAADRQMTGKGQHRIGELDVAVGERLGAGEGGELRHRIIGRVEPVGARVLEPRDHRFSVRRELPVADPQRRVSARGVECLDRLALGRALDALLELLGGDDIAQLVVDLRVAGGEYFVERAVDVEIVAGVGIARCGGGLRPRFRGRRRVADRRRCQRRGFAVARGMAVERRRQRHDRFDAVWRGDTHRRRRDNQRQHRAGKQTVDLTLTHIARSTHSNITRTDRIVRNALTEHARSAPRTRLHRYYAAECAR